MLPFDKDRKNPMSAPTPSVDIEGAALEQAMSRFINAVQGGNVAEAISSWKNICALGETY